MGEGVRWAVMKLSCGGRRRGGMGRWVVVNGEDLILVVSCLVN